MLNQVAVEALYSATYVENYLDSVENLPDDIQRQLSRIREIDVQYRGHLRDVDNYYDQWSNCLSHGHESASSTKRNRTMTRIQQSLIAAQELGDEKLHIVSQLQELIDHKTRQLEQDFKALDYGKDEQSIEPIQKETRPVTPALASPVHSTAPLQVYPSTTTPNTTSSMTISSNDRYTASSSGSNSNANNNSGNNNDRPAKRARRTRNDNSNNNSGVELNVSSDTVMPIEPSTIAKQNANASAQSSNSTNQKKTNSTGGSGAGGGGGSGGGGAGGGGGGGGKKKKRKSGRQTNSNQQAAAAARETRDETPPIEEAIDPDEPTYCLCDQISFGEMILCDNDLCPIEWFHFSCVSLMSKPKGKWFCPNCRGERPNVMKPKAQFLKELERYNKEKEEKT